MLKPFHYLLLLFSLLGSGCSQTRYLSDGEYLLKKVKVKSDVKRPNNTDWTAFLRQQPSSHIQLLNLYNYSGRDTTKSLNRFLRKMGSAPIVYDSVLTARSEGLFLNYLQNKGYIDAEVSSSVVLKNKKAEVTYYLKGNEPYFINSYSYVIANEELSRFIVADSSRSKIKPNSYFDVDELNAERDRITTLLRNRGYYNFNRELLRYEADSINHRVDLTLELASVADTTEAARSFAARPPVRRVSFYTAYDPMSGSFSRRDSISYQGHTIYYDGKSFLRPAVLLANCFIREQAPYSDQTVERTYEAFNALSAVRYVNVRFREVNDSLDCFIMLSPYMSQSYSVDIEGTNSGGDFGFAGGVTYSHHNVFKGSEVLNMKFRSAYEGLSGDFQDFLNNKYMELGGSASLTFPKFMFPFLSERVRRRSRAQTEFLASYNYQQRPEFVRNISELAWRYKWSLRRFQKHSFDLIDLSYAYLPWISPDFYYDFIAYNSILSYSYKDHLILRMGYVFTYNTSQPGQTNPRVQSLRIAAESGGNLTYLAFSIFAPESKTNREQYSIFNIPFAQYAKVDIDYAQSTRLDERSSIAWRMGAGVACPYLNSDILPFEKRYYSGGANSVRGWSVRTLGPGTIADNNQVSDLIVQSGDIRLDLNVEFRNKLFWIMELAAYIDAGNVWTIRDYDFQPGGLFRFDSFYKEIAMSYGLGLRFDFSYFLIRIDSGMKAYNPALEGADRWTIVHPNLKGNFAWHFAIGYPF